MISNSNLKLAIVNSKFAIANFKFAICNLQFAIKDDFATQNLRIN